MRFTDYEPYMTEAQKIALSQIEELGRKMFRARYEDDLFDLYCEADDLWEEYFPFFAEQEGDRWYLTRRYNDLAKRLRNKPDVVTVNIFGNNITVNVKGGDK